MNFKEFDMIKYQNVLEKFKIEDEDEVIKIYVSVDINIRNILKNLNLRKVMRFLKLILEVIIATIMVQLYLVIAEWIKAIGKEYSNSAAKFIREDLKFYSENSKSRM